jgi:NAD(P)-dependent dehydrogenase (short-subunit alcohol dehydrogenase family)
MVSNLQIELKGTGVTASIVHPGPTRTNMGTNVPPETVGPLVEDLVKWGFARHDRHLAAADLARAVAFVAETPRGAYVASMLLEPEAPLAE